MGEERATPSAALAKISVLSVFVKENRRKI